MEVNRYAVVREELDRKLEACGPDFEFDKWLLVDYLFRGSGKNRGGFELKLYKPTPEGYELVGPYPLEITEDQLKLIELPNKYAFDADNAPRCAKRIDIYYQGECLGFYNYGSVNWGPREEPLSASIESINDDARAALEEFVYDQGEHGFGLVAAELIDRDEFLRVGRKRRAGKRIKNQG